MSQSQSPPPPPPLPLPEFRRAPYDTVPQWEPQWRDMYWHRLDMYNRNRPFYEFRILPGMQRPEGPSPWAFAHLNGPPPLSPEEQRWQDFQRSCFAAQKRREVAQEDGEDDDDDEAATPPEGGHDSVKQVVPMAIKAALDMCVLVALIAADVISAVPSTVSHVYVSLKPALKACCKFLMIVSASVLMILAAFGDSLGGGREVVGELYYVLIPDVRSWSL